LLNTKVISERLNVSEETVRRWIRTGELPATSQDGKSYVVDESDLHAFVKKKAATPGTSLSKKNLGSLLSIAKAVPVAGAVVGGAAALKGKDIASNLLSMGLDKWRKESSKKESQEVVIEDWEDYLETLHRQKKKLELEYQMKMLEIEEEIANCQKIIKANKGREE
jgi:excisionase family DNA binding protein